MSVAVDVHQGVTIVLAATQRPHMFVIRSFHGYVQFLSGVDVGLQGRLLPGLNEWLVRRGAWSNEPWPAYLERAVPRGAPLAAKLQWARGLLEEFFAEVHRNLRSCPKPFEVTSGRNNAR